MAIIISDDVARNILDLCQVLTFRMSDRPRNAHEQHTWDLVNALRGAIPKDKLRAAALGWGPAAGRETERFIIEEAAGRSHDIIGWAALLKYTGKREDHLRIKFSAGRGVAMFGRGEHAFRITRERDIIRHAAAKEAAEKRQEMLRPAAVPEPVPPKKTKASVAPPKKVPPKRGK